MVRPKRLVVLVAVAAMLAATVVVLTKTTLYPVSATFRCPGVDCASADAIQGDGLGAYVGSTSEQDGAYLDGGFNFYCPLPQNPIAPDVLRRVVFDFGQASPGRVETYLSYPALVKAVDATNTFLPSGFYSIPLGGQAPARVKFDFPDPSDPSHYFYTLRWQGSAVPNSTSSLVTVTRTASNVWVIEAGTSKDPVTGLPTEVALLQRTNISGHQVTQNIGVYDMPFQITVQCGSAATPCPKN